MHNLKFVNFSIAYYFSIFLFLSATAKGRFQVVVKLPLVQRSPVSPTLGDLAVSLCVSLSHFLILLSGLVDGSQESQGLQLFCNSDPDVLVCLLCSGLSRMW